MKRGVAKLSVAVTVCALAILASVETAHAWRYSRAPSHHRHHPQRLGCDPWYRSHFRPFVHYHGPHWHGSRHGGWNSGWSHWGRDWDRDWIERGWKR
jgi:hypothetical protein